MKNSAMIIVTAIASIFLANYIVLAFTEPTGAPPLNNVPAPLNVGSGRQVKNGDLTVNNIKAASITLGEDTRTAWPSGTSGTGGAGGTSGVRGESCSWQGNKCRCSTSRLHFDGGWFRNDLTMTARNITYMTCKNGTLTDFQNSIELLPDSQVCPSVDQAAEWFNCAPGEYYGN